MMMSMSAPDGPERDVLRRSGQLDGQRKPGSSPTRWFRLMVVVTILTALSVMSSTPAAASGSEQVGGTAVPYPVAPDTCDPDALGPVDYVLAMSDGTGSLTGCIYGTVESFRFSPGGQDNTLSSEVFVGCLDDRCGSFELDARITARIVGGEPGTGDQVNGRCQHKVVSGSGTGDFAGVEGRLDFKDILVYEDGVLVDLSYDYKGHLRFT